MTHYVWLIRTMAGVAIIIFLAPGISLAQKVSLDYDKSAPFKQYKTYAWVPMEKIPIVAADPSNPQVSLEVVDRLVRATVQEELKKKGYRHLIEGEPDFKINYVGIWRIELDATTRDAGNPGSYYRPFPTLVNDARLRREGTLTLDIIDAKSDTTV